MPKLSQKEFNANSTKNLADTKNSYERIGNCGRNCRVSTGWRTTFIAQSSSWSNNSGASELNRWGRKNQRIERNQKWGRNHLNRSLVKLDWLRFISILSPFYLVRSTPRTGCSASVTHSCNSILSIPCLPHHTLIFGVSSLVIFRPKKCLSVL